MEQSNLAVAGRPVNRLWRSRLDVCVAVRLGDEEPLPDECFPLPEESLAALIHLCPEADLVQGAVEPYFLLRALNEDEVAVARAADALVADGFAGNLHTGGRFGEKRTGVRRIRLLFGAATLARQSGAHTM